MNTATETNPTIFGTQDPKYGIKDGQLVNLSSGVPIPGDEPVFILRAKDKNSIMALYQYLDLCDNPTHIVAVNRRIEEFERFKDINSERMKEPDTIFNE